MCCPKRRRLSRLTYQQWFGALHFRTFNSLPMDKCPLEICLHIFSLACTDDGSTGRSLSLVSRGFAEVSRTVQLQSIALWGSSQLAGFASILRDRYSKGQKVHHLFMSDKPRKTPSGQSIAQERIDSQNARKIIRIVAPSLATLSLVVERGLWGFIQYGFPMLTELSARVSFIDLEDLFGPRCTIPNLRGLYLACQYDGIDIPSDFAEELSRRFPQLHYLYVHGMLHENISREFVIALENHMSRETPRSPYPNEYQGRLPSTLKSVVIDRSFSRSGNFFRSSSADIVQSLSRLARSDTNDFLHLGWVAPLWVSKDSSDVEAMYGWWLQGIEGTSVDNLWSASRVHWPVYKQELRSN